MRMLLLSLVAVLCVVSVQCQDEEGGGGGGGSGQGMWAKFKGMVKELLERLKGLFKDMQEEIRSRTAEMGSWSLEAFNSFKQKMNEWINDRAGASDKEKEDMRNYVEKMQMPPEIKEEQ